MMRPSFVVLAACGLVACSSNATNQDSNRASATAGENDSPPTSGAQAPSPDDGSGNGRRPSCVRAKTIHTGYAVPEAVNNNGAVIFNPVNVGSPRPSDTLAMYYDGTKSIALPSLGGNASAAVAMNDHGDVVGFASLPNNRWHAALWRNGVVTDLGTLGGGGSIAWAIAENGDIVGMSTLADGSEHAVLWHDGVARDLGANNGDLNWGLFVNERSQALGFTVIGFGNRGGLIKRPVFWNNGEPSLLSPSGVDDTMDVAPIGLGAGGEALITSSLRDGVAAWVWKAGVFTRVRPFPNATSFRVAGINDHGDVAGDVSDRGFLWHPDGSAEAVVPPASVSRLKVERVAANGQIVGETMEGAQQSEFHPFTWKGGKFVYLSDALGVPWSMNDHGLIAVIIGAIDIQQPHSVELVDTSACFEIDTTPPGGKTY